MKAMRWAVTVLVAAIVAGCGDTGDTPRGSRDPSADAKIERLLSLIVEVERQGGAAPESLSAEANAIIEEMGGQDSAANLLTERLLDNADRWVPLLDSLARASGAARIPPQ
jgi:hypothetical protein